MPFASREIHLAARPAGMPTPADFKLVEREIPDPAEGQVVVQNLLMSVDPYMRPRLSKDQPVGAVMDGGAIGRVVASRHPDFAEGQIVRNGLGFREAFLSDGAGLSKLTPDPTLPLSVYMHALGGTGYTAYGGLLHVGALKDGEQVFVSTAAGAVGSVACQIAKIKGCYVVGSTGSDDKVRWLVDEAGVDAAINYKTQAIGPALLAATPKGVDVYFDNVGGDHLSAALPRMNLLGRIPVCGTISEYNGVPSPVTGLFAIIYARVTIRGFVAPDFPDAYAPFQADMTDWLKDGLIKYQETWKHGIDNAPAALIGLLNGENSGKMLVKLAD
jgi:NADPH-dependent curcumin reductase CurA